mmetsp:Transcript_52189/g.113098  ORF Transcript_52189/g.113098 Transcript_52189/m.113098 type:complete len:206 (-) Transcript_52189:524-1141(-)
MDWEVPAATTALARGLAEDGGDRGEAALDADVPVADTVAALPEESRAVGLPLAERVALPLQPVAADRVEDEGPAFFPLWTVAAQTAPETPPELEAVFDSAPPLTDLGCTMGLADGGAREHSVRQRSAVARAAASSPLSSAACSSQERSLLNSSMALSSLRRISKMSLSFCLQSLQSLQLVGDAAGRLSARCTTCSCSRKDSSSSS